jgi:hypothetical protein
LDDRLEVRSQIRTGLRSSLNLRLGQTILSIRSGSLASIERFHRDAGREVVNIGLGYGTVRGGSTEGAFRSDVVIDSTVATLAKRGTEGWQMSVEPVTGRFHISLAEHGLVEAIQKMQREKRPSRLIRPGEYATETSIANLWIKQDIFDRNVNFFEPEGASASDAEFNAENTRGYGVMAPGGGSVLPGLSGQANAQFVLDQLAARSPAAPRSTVVIEPGTLGRPEGNFGTGPTFRVRVGR